MGKMQGEKQPWENAHCSRCTGPNAWKRGRRVAKARDKREWQAEAERETAAEEFSGYWEDARRHLIESGYDPDVAASMAALHALEAMSGRP